MENVRRINQLRKLQLLENKLTRADERCNNVINELFSLLKAYLLMIYLVHFCLVWFSFLCQLNSTTHIFQWTKIRFSRISASDGAKICYHANSQLKLKDFSALSLVSFWSKNVTTYLCQTPHPQQITPTPTLLSPVPVHLDQTLSTCNSIII